MEEKATATCLVCGNPVIPDLSLTDDHGNVVDEACQQTVASSEAPSRPARSFLEVLEALLPQSNDVPPEANIR